jgi:uncharacterized membrane protein YoaK (UPF0700 family)
MTLDTERGGAVRWSLPSVLAFTGGYADASGYLALKGLFTAHVTGNFVTLGSSLVFGTSGALTKTLALPMFCAVVLLSRLLAFRLQASRRPVFTSLVRLQVLVLTVGAGLAVWLGPFDDPDGWRALVTGMTLVAAMALQNATHRTHLANAPPSTIMTGTTTQLMLDLADMLHGLRPEIAAATRARVRRLTASVVVFAAGCGLAAVFYARVNTWCFCVLPLLGLATLTARKETNDAAV